MKTGKEFNILSPQTMNEKIQWLKMYDTNQMKSVLADKYKVREWVKNKIGEEYLIPLLNVWKNPQEITFEDLPSRFVL